MIKHLEIKWSISKARDTYGYNICTLVDGTRKFKAYGGGYDMQGQVFGQWLEANYMDKIETLQPYNRKTGKEGFYGLFVGHTGKIILDGSCGLSTMIEIAKAINLSVQSDYKRGQLKGFFINEG